MKLIFLCNLFVWMSSAHEYKVDQPKNLNCNCGWTNSESEKIIYPWVVPIFAKEDEHFLCAGTILTKRHVLSTANCLENKDPIGIIVCVENKASSSCGVDAIRMQAKHISIRKGFNKEKYINNLAIVHTVDVIKFNKNVGPACFPHEKISYENFIGTELMFLGWGESEEQLKRIDFKAKAEEQICKTIYKHIQTEMHICVWSHSKQNVKGDGGGTYVMLDKDTQRYTVVGVIASIPSKPYRFILPSLITNFTDFRWWARRRVLWRRHAHLCHKK